MLPLGDWDSRLIQCWMFLGHKQGFHPFSRFCRSQRVTDRLTDWQTDTSRRGITGLNSPISCIPCGLINGSDLVDLSVCRSRSVTQSFSGGEDDDIRMMPTGTSLSRGWYLGRIIKQQKGRGPPQPILVILVRIIGIEPPTSPKPTFLLSTIHEPSQTRGETIREWGGAS